MQNETNRQKLTRAVFEYGMACRVYDDRPTPQTWDAKKEAFNRVSKMIEELVPDETN